MNFHEKLSRLMVDRNRSAVSRRAGLGSSTLASYLIKESIPRADFAFQIAKALGVSIEWMLDNSRGWPPVWSSPPVEAERPHKRTRKVA